MTVTDDKPVTGEIVQYQPSAVAEYQPRFVMTPEDAKALDDRLREGMRAILKEGVDYGPIPGGDPDRKNLHKPGAEKLLQWFGFGSRSTEVKIERDDPENPSGVADKARRIGVTYRTEVFKTVPGLGDVTVATCEGYAGYDEDRYYKTSEEAQAKAKAKEEFWARKDGRQPNPNKWQHILDDYRAPWNTVVKMAQKRSYVGAAIDATGAAGLFTQDMEDAATAETVSPVAAISEPANAAIMGLPVEARKALDRWCREQGWPARDDWDATQWCAALVQAGRIAMEREFAQRGAETVKGTEDPWITHPAPEEWVEAAVTKASGLTGKAGATALYEETVAKCKAGEITETDKSRVCNLIIARITDLDAQQAKEGTVTAPDGDPWQAEIDSMSTREDAIPLLDKLETARTDGTVDGRRYKALKAAIRTKADSLPSAPGEAA